MKLPVKSLSVALAVAAASSTAYAGSVPVGTAASPAGTLTLEVFKNDGVNPVVTELVNLNQTYAATSNAAPGNALTPNAPTGAFTVAADPTGGAGSVLQIDYGVIPQFSATFGTGASTSFIVMNPNGQTAAELTTNNASVSLGTATGFQSAATTAVGILGNWRADTTTATTSTEAQGYSIDTTGTVTWSAKGTGAGLGLTGGQNYSAGVGQALLFYSPTGTSRTYTAPQYANATGPGFWFLSSTGVLSYNVPTSAGAPVPLPAAAWLLVSGIAGLGAVGRRRRQAAA